MCIRDRLYAIYFLSLTRRFITRFVTIAAFVFVDVLVVISQITLLSMFAVPPESTMVAVVLVLVMRFTVKPLNVSEAERLLDSVPSACTKRHATDAIVSVSKYRDQSTV